MDFINKERNKTIFLDYLNKANYAVSQYRGEQSGGQNLEFISEAEAEAANLAPGTRITINGRPAIWE